MTWLVYLGAGFLAAFGAGYWCGCRILAEVEAERRELADSHGEIVQ